MEILSDLQGVKRVGLAGDYLRVISSGIEEEAMREQLEKAGVETKKIERGEPTLEDVFLELAR